MLKKVVQGAALVAMVLAAGTAHAADAKAGKKVFRKCRACHKVEAGKNGVGPSLHGIVGKEIATVEGFKYSSGMQEFAAGKTWTPEELDAFLANPKKHVKGTKMAFPGLKKDDDRANVVAYLQEQQ